MMRGASRHPPVVEGLLMPFWEGRVDNRGIKLHFMVNVPELQAGAGTPLVIVPDVAESAEDYADLLEALAPRPAFALSLRGRGQSSAPQEGYTLDHHASDVAALLHALDLPPVCLMGYARGVPYALSVAAAFPERVAGLIVADYPAQHDAVPRGWITDLLESVWRGVPVSERLMPFVAEGIQREGEDIPLWDLLPAIACPTLIMYGGMPGARLSLPDVERYLQALPNARALRFTESDHRLWLPDPGRYLVAVGDFLARVDQAQ
jgi:pimeloyl-ACP methyl ester carboxylesterase